MVNCGLTARRRWRCRLDGLRFVITRDLIGRLTRSKPPVDLRTFDMLACAALSCHGTHSTLFDATHLSRRKRRLESGTAADRPPNSFRIMNE
jgi:hypothetical protein